MAQPAPIGGGREDDPHGNPQSAGEMGNGGVGGDDQIELAHDGGRVHEGAAVLIQPREFVNEKFRGDFIDLLTAMTIQIEEPLAFDRGDLSSRQELNPRTAEILRGYVLALGLSLPSKRTGVREVAIATFERYASEEYCTGEPLIEKRLADQLLLHARSNHSRFVSAW